MNPSTVELSVVGSMICGSFTIGFRRFPFAGFSIGIAESASTTPFVPNNSITKHR